MSTPAHKNPTIIANGLATLEEINDLCRSLHYAALLTDDGFEVVSLPGTRVQGSRMASMASSMQALSDAVAREVKIGSSEYIIIAAEKGYVIQLRIPGETLVLSAMFGDSETLGKALSVSRLASTKMAALMSSATA